MGNQCTSISSGGGANMSSASSSSPPMTKKKDIFRSSTSFILQNQSYGGKGSPFSNFDDSRHPLNEIMKRSSSTSTGFVRRNGGNNGWGDDSSSMTQSPTMSGFFPSSVMSDAYMLGNDEPFILGRHDSTFGMHPDFNEVRSSFSTKRRRSSIELGLD